MSRLRFPLLLLLILLVSTTAFAAGGIKKIYYSDCTYTTAVGGRYDPAWDCPEDDLWWAWGSASAYRKIFEYTDCYEWGEETVYCQQWTGSGWIYVDCP